MKLADFRRLKGIMARTASDSDAEALASIRAANRLLAVEGLTWARVLDRTVSVRREVEEAPRDVDSADRMDVDSAFERALDKAKGDFRDFLLSLRDQWEDRNWLSEAQRDTLMRAADR